MPGLSVLWATYGMVGFLAAVFVVWKTLAAADFLYPVWYDLLHIDQHIATYAPRNFIRPRFAETTRQERERLFSGVVDAIQHDGQGLRDLTYHMPDGTAIRTLLRPPEVTHLDDVAKLVTRCTPYGWAAVLIWLGVSVSILITRIKPPSVRRQLTYGVSATVLGLLGILVAGPLRVFTAFHEAVFPSGHQWYFYYEDSLMSTFMKAPDLFFAIAAVWMGGSLLLWLSATALLPRAARSVSRP